MIRNCSESARVTSSSISALKHSLAQRRFRSDSHLQRVRPEELIGLLGAVATAILAVIIVMMLYFGREIIIPIALGNSS